MFAGDTERVESAGEFHHHGKSPLEREADWFASELLVPTSQLGPRIDAQPASIGTLQSLADEFRTSLTMMAIRHAELTDRATASILSRDGRADSDANRPLIPTDAVHPFRRKSSTWMRHHCGHLEMPARWSPNGWGGVLDDLMQGAVLPTSREILERGGRRWPGRGCPCTRFEMFSG